MSPWAEKDWLIKLPAQSNKHTQLGMKNFEVEVVFICTYRFCKYRISNTLKRSRFLETFHGNILVILNIILHSHHIGVCLSVCLSVWKKRPVYFSAGISADVIHTVGPIAQGGVGEEEKKALRACYRNSLQAAACSGARSVVRWLEGWMGECKIWFEIVGIKWKRTS